MDSFDASSFFMLHDLLGKGYWTPNEILYIYGLTRDEIVGDGSGMGEHDHAETIPQILKDKVIKEVSVLLRAEENGNIPKKNWLEFSEKGGVLPDFGLGPGHHMDFEAEYENHHWNKYHRDQDPDVHTKHKEDIEHELLHHAHEIEETHSDEAGRKQAKDYVSPVNIQNIPQKYLAK
ncbi:hypothetical protein JCM33374_g633 [Metschnikowia sp. JCM 33374]|nr:hypothetical protein JCM33374_g633 [Metschnikowia sp. JCM 33374]